jgi:hypothetical protein
LALKTYVSAPHKQLHLIDADIRKKGHFWIETNILRMNNLNIAHQEMVGFGPREAKAGFKP